LIVFAFGNTPKRYLHDAVATHSHNEELTSTGAAANFHLAGFNCKMDNLVAESPFTENHQELCMPLSTVFWEKPAEIPRYYYSFKYYFFELRGPPASIA
jgi:hypothetical protein